MATKYIGNTITVESIVGTRTCQEDRYLIHRSSRGLLMGVLDGHGGTKTSDSLSKLIPGLWDKLADAKPKTFSISILIRALFRSLDEVSATHTSGTTLSLALLSKGSIVTATLGDSPIFVLPREGASVERSTLHNLDNLDEVQRVKDLGAEINSGYLWGYKRGLAMTRSLGDVEFSQWLSREPEVRTFSTENPKVVIATDGVFPVFKSFSAEDMELPAKEIVSQAADPEKNTHSDNITVIKVN